MNKRIPVLKSMMCVLSLAFSAMAAASAERPVLPLPQAGEIGTQCKASLETLSQKVSELENIPVETEEGAEAFRLWTGKDMPVALIKEKFFSEI